MKKNKHLVDGLFRIILSAFFMLSCSMVSAQTSKGLWMVGGNLGFNNQEDYSSFNISPNGGYLFTDHIGAGLSFNFSGSFSEYSNGYSTALLPYVRYYLGSSKTQPFFMASAGFANYRYKGKGDFSDYDSSSWDFRWNAGVGVSHFLNRNAAIEGIIGYNGSVFISFGFQIFLEPGKE